MYGYNIDLLQAQLVCTVDTVVDIVIIIVTSKTIQRAPLKPFKVSLQLSS